MIHYHKFSQSKCFSETTGSPPLQNPVFSRISPLLQAAFFMFALLTPVSWSS